MKKQVVETRVKRGSIIIVIITRVLPPSIGVHQIRLTHAPQSITYQPVCMKIKSPSDELPETKRKLLEASVALMRTKGFNGTSVDDICAAAGVTKGGFFHYFKSKEEVAKAAAHRFRDTKAESYRTAPYRELADPLDRVFGRLDFMVSSASSGDSPTLGCLIGMLAQELSFTHPDLRVVFQESFARMSKDLEQDLTEAKELHAPDAVFDPAAVTSMFIAMYQGSLLMAKAFESNAVLVKNVDSFREYLQTLFNERRPVLKRR